MDELDDLDPNGLHHDVNERFVIEANFYDILTEAERVKNPTPQPLIRTNTTDSAETMASTASVLRRKVKLPESRLPTFKSDFAHWTSFKTEFESMVGSQQGLNPSDKLHYLKSALQGDAARKIQMLSITDSNYNRAWEMLERAYSDKRIIASRHAQCLLHLPIQTKEDADGLSTIIDSTRQHVESLRAMELEVGDLLIITLLENKIHRTTADAWEDKQERDVIPQLEDMLEFLSRRAARLSKQPRSRQGNAASAQQPIKNKLTHRQPATQAFGISTGQACTICKDGSHPLYRCRKFLDLSVQQRLKVVKDSSFCPNCLNKHDKTPCKFGGCKSCGQRHNTLLHAPTENETSTQAGTSGTTGEVSN